MIVADASVVIDALIGSGPRSDGARARLVGAGEAHVPHLVDLEVASALRRLRAARSIDATLAEQALDDLERLPLLRYPHLPLLARAWELRGSLSVYDGAYVALAEALEVVLVTADAPLARAPGPQCTIELTSPPG